MKKNLKRITVLICTFFIFNTIIAQEYKFEELIDLKTSEVKSQGKTGTCWSFSTSSFLESEIFRITGKNIDLSEMYSVRVTYPKKAWNYVMRQGKTQFSEGGLSHDVINSIEVNGLVPENAFTGLFGEEITYNHKNIVPAIKNVLNAYIKNDKNSKYSDWKKATDSILNVEIGEIPTTFLYENKTYTPQSFLKMTKLNVDNYISLTSFNHQPTYSKFILNIPDNFSNGSFYNLPLDELITSIDNALKNGYTLALDIDVSEKTFSSKNGVATIPENIEDVEKAKKEIVKEKIITPELRQQEFENYNTTDDHLMHITGILKDQNGTVYYKVKNSWGNNSKRIGNNGYIFISRAYLKLKTISVLVHKDAVSKKLKEKLEN